MTIVRWNPVNEPPHPMVRAFDHFFGGPGGNGFPWTDASAESTAWTPSIDVYETTDELVVRAELPGMRRDDIDLRIENGMLTISGQKTADTESSADNYHRLERRYGRFIRSFRLPTLVGEDRARATYEDGLLTVRLPKAESVKPRRIEIAA